jgi:hypothetical protein
MNEIDFNLLTIIIFDDEIINIVLCINKYNKVKKNITNLGMRHFPKGHWKNLKEIQISIILNIKAILLSVIRHANILLNVICPIYRNSIFVE